MSLPRTETEPALDRLQWLSKRVEPVHLRQRLGIEAEGEQPVFGQGRTRIHPENAFSLERVLRLTLQLGLVYERGRRNALDLEVRRHDVALPRLPAAFEAFTLLQLSDLHLDMNREFPARLREVVADLDYDVCVLTGDFRYRTSGPSEPALEALAYLREGLREPVYAVLGNHDSIRMAQAIEEMGIRLLLNESIALEREESGIYLAGVDDPHFFRADNLERACHGIPDDAVSILLSHSPELFRQAAHAGFDLMLCGHTHGGQINLPGGLPLFLNAKCPRRYGRGAWRHQGMIGYTAVGAGSSIIDVRFNCRPEVTLHRLTRSLEN